MVTKDNFPVIMIFFTRLRKEGPTGCSKMLRATIRRYPG